jgi:hypothetical protein
MGQELIAGVKMKQYTNFGGEKVELPEVVKYYFKNATVEVQGIDAADCRETLEQRIANPHELTRDVFICSQKLSEYHNKQRAP